MIEAPLALHGETVREEWIDYNGHMNVAYYVLVFDHATDALFDLIDLGQAYMRRAGATLFVLEAHVTYQRELVAGDPLRVTTQLLGVGPKRLHFFHAMHHGERGYLAATSELLAIHVDLSSRRSAPIPAEPMSRLRAIEAGHRSLPRTAEVGRVIGLGARRAG
jgi:acyl-CoA thioester hydrolase